MKCFKKHTIVFLSLIISMFFTASAHADLLYGAMSGGYTTDIMGVIIGNAAPNRVVTNLGGTMGARISSFRTETGGARTAFCEYSNNKGDSIKIYKPYDGTWTPIKDFAAPANPVANIREMAYMGKYLYACGYDLATVARFDTTNDGYINDRTFNGLNTGKWHAEAMATYKGSVYVVMTHASDPWQGDGGYSKNKLIKFDADLNMVTSMDLNGKNVDGGTVGAWALQEGKLYIASIGGAQSYSFKANMASNIDVVDLDKWTVKEVINNESLLAQYNDEEDVLGVYAKDGWGFDFKSIAVTPQKDVYIMMNGWGPNHSIVIKTNVSDLENAKTNAKTKWTVIKEFDFTSYVFPAMLYDPGSSILYVCGAEGSESTGSMYRYNGSKWLSRYDSSALGGAFSAVAASVILKPVSYVASSDITASSNAGAVMINSIIVSDDVSELNGLSDYSVAVNGIDSTKVIYPVTKIIVAPDHSGIPDDASITFTIQNFKAELTAGGSFKAFIKKHGSEKYDIFDAVYNPQTQELTFNIGPVGEYFSEGTILIGELADKNAPAPSGSGSSGGCNTGWMALTLLAAFPAVTFKRKGKKK